MAYSEIRTSQLGLAESFMVFESLIELLSKSFMSRSRKHATKQNKSIVSILSNQNMIICSTNKCANYKRQWMMRLLQEPQHATYQASSRSAIIPPGF